MAEFSNIDVAGRCKQCGKGYTQFDKVSGTTGVFCSEECREKHEAFMKRAAAIDARPRSRPSIGFKLRKLVRSLVTLLILFAFVGVVSVVFNIPVLAPFFVNLRRMTGW
jgi:hypothetical protein